MGYDTYLVNPYHGMSNSYIGATENEWEDGLGVDNALLKNYDRITGGGLYDLQFNFGANYNDRLYLGANFNVKMVDYSENLYYSEAAQQGDWYDSGFKSMKYHYWQETSGAGINLQLGAIWTPTDYLRLGVSYTTPTLYTLTDTWQEDMHSTFEEGLPEYKSADSETPQWRYDYNLRAPARLSLGAAVVFGTAGLISADIERVNYGKIRMSDNYGYDNSFSEVNEDIAKYLPSSTIVRLGAEMNVLNDCALRAGYTGYFYNAPGYQYVSFGIGKRISENSSIDLAFRTSLRDKYEMTPYDDYAPDADGNMQCLAPVAGISAAFRDLMLTYRVKF
jgi:long-subunit fatty acid transport protein